MLPTEFIDILNPEKLVASKLCEISEYAEEESRSPQVLEGECAEWVCKRRLVVPGLTYLIVLTVLYLMKGSMRVLLICWKTSD